MEQRSIETKHCFSMCKQDATYKQLMLVRMYPCVKRGLRIQTNICIFYYLYAYTILLCRCVYKRNNNIFFLNRDLNAMGLFERNIPGNTYGCWEMCYATSVIFTTCHIVHVCKWRISVYGLKVAGDCNQRNTTILFQGIQ